MRLRVVAGSFVAAAVVFCVACSDDASAPAPSGACSGTGCADGGASSPEASTASDSAAPPPADAGGDAGAIVYPDPLAGTTKTATLVKAGFQFTEGPLWIGGRLLFTDIPAATIYQLEANGTTSVFRAQSGNANGLAVDPQGRLLAAEHGNHRVSRSLADTGATVTAVTERFEGKRYNSPNDVIVRADGNVYFTDPDYGGPIQNDNQLPIRGVYRVDPQGNVTRIADDLAKPNGIALSPDQSTLYVDDTEGGFVRHYPVNADGSVGAPAKLFDTAQKGCDGMAVDDAGNLYVTTQAGVEVFDRAGKPLGTITVAKTPTNASFGGVGRRVLYITAQDSLYSITTNVPGLP